MPSTFLDHSIFATIGDSDRDKPPAFLIDALLYKLRLIRRDGFYRRSIALSEQRVSVKGKIEVTPTIRNCLTKGREHQVQCNYFDLTNNTIENRFIKYTLWLILHLRGLSKEAIATVKEFWRLFTNIPLSVEEQFSKPIERIIHKREIPSGRSYYLDILSLCFLIVNHTTVVVKEGEDIRLSAFVIDMNRTFENYIRNIITSALYPDFKVLKMILKSWSIRIFADSRGNPFKQFSAYVA